MPVFFNGRRVVSPASLSAVNDSAMHNKNLTLGNIIALIGMSDGGKPNTALKFNTPTEAAATLVSGELLTAVQKAFDASAQTGSPTSVVAVRVNPALQSVGTLFDGSAAAVINLTSTDYGLRTNNIKYKVEAASVSGKKLTVMMGNDYFSADNVARNAFSIRYSGAQASATLAISGTTVTLAAPAGTPVATIDLNSFANVQGLVDRINVVPGFLATVKDGNGQTVALNGLDYVTAQDVKTADYVATANLQAIVDWFNSTGEGFVNATRVAAVGTIPANVAFTYLTGGSNGVVTNNEWQNAYTVLQGQDVQIVTPITGTSAIHAMNDAHCAFMSNVARLERRGFVGTVAGTTDQQAKDAAKALNSDRTSLVHIGYYDYDANGTLTLYPPYMSAALLAGARGGLGPAQSMTNKTIKVRGLERDLRNPTDTDDLIDAGVYCLENTTRGFKVVKDITTWLVNDNYNRVEVMTGVGTDFTVRTVRDALDILRGEKGSPILLSRAVSITESALRELSRAEPQGPGILVGDDVNPPYKNITAKLEGGVLRVEYQASVGIPVNYVLSSVYLVPYSGTVSI